MTAADLVGERIGDYTIESLLGAGGMGVVYCAQDTGLRRTVALKLLAPQFLQDSIARTRFQREIESAVAIEHPHVVPVYGAGYEPPHFYLAMRYVRGPDLAEIIHQGGRIPEARAMRLVGQIVSALHTVHAQGIVHRDVKPQNVLVWDSGSSDEHAFLTDFGIAKALSDTNRLTRAGALGTPGYMAPELLGGAEATPACDQYSLACLAFELLTGRLPFAEGKDGDKEVAESPLPLEYFAPKSSLHVRRTVERALASDPAERFPDVRAFVLSDDAAHESFERSQAITDTVSRGRSTDEVVNTLHRVHGLSDAAIAEIADLEKSRVVKLRRQAARRSLIGE